MSELPMTKDNCLHKNLEAKIIIGNVSKDNPIEKNSEGYVFTAVIGNSYYDGLYECKNCEKRIRISLAMQL